MKKKHIVVLVAMMICLLSLAGSGIFVANVLNAKKEADAEKEANKVSYDTFAAWTDVESFQNVPIMPGERNAIGKIQNYGKKDYIVNVENTTVEEYKEYLDVLVDAGFKKHSDNGEDAMEGYAYTAAFTKDEITVVVSHIIREGKTYISANEKRALSDHMIYKEEYVQGLDPNAKNSLHLVELGNNGASIVVKLKNGHFVIHDGGNGFDALYLLDYLESLTPGDEVPVVEGWFISHAHGDHYGALSQIASSTRSAKRVIVNGVYFHYAPADALKSETTLASDTCNALASMLKDENGERAGNYRPQFGQRYYFCDVTLDVCLTTEQRAIGTFSTDVNDTSSWFKMNIDGQSILIGGDGSVNETRTMISLFDESYYAVDVFVVLHHGMNVYKHFVERLEAKTLLYPCFRAASLYSNKYPHFAREEENEMMRTKAQEYYSHGEGTVVLTFPYKVGTAQIMEPCKWQYHGGMPPERTTTEWGWEWDGLRYYYNP